MTTRTTIRSWPAMGLAVVFLAGTSFVLFQDLLDGARITTGHQIVTMFRARRFGIALGMVILTAAALAYVATMSGARNAEQASNKAERIDGSNKARVDIIAERSRAQAMLDQARADIARECASGEGSRCRGRRATEAVYSAAVAGHDARLATLPAQQTPNAGYKAAAEAIVLVGLTSRTQADVEKALIVLLPWLAVLIAELGTIVFLSSALGHKSVPSIADSLQTSFAVQAIDSASARQSFEDDPPPSPVPPGSGRKVKRLPATEQSKRLPANVVSISGYRHPVISALERVGKPMTNQELARAMGVTPGESSKRWPEIEHMLDVSKHGKCLQIGLKSWRQASA